MTADQQINNLKRQAAEALKTGNFTMMNNFAQEATAAKTRKADDLFLQMGREIRKTMPKPVVPAAVVNQSTRRVIRVNR